MKKTLLIVLGLLVFGALTLNVACDNTGDDDSAPADDDSAV